MKFIIEYFSGQALYSKLIKYKSSDAPVSHVRWVVENWDKRTYVECLVTGILQGKVFVTDQPTHEEQPCEVYEFDITQEQCLKLTQFANQCDWADYDFTAILSYFLARDYQDPNKRYCSENTIVAGQLIGLFVWFEKGTKITPWICRAVTKQAKFNKNKNII